MLSRASDTETIRNRNRSAVAGASEKFCIDENDRLRSNLISLLLMNYEADLDSPVASRM